MIQSIGCFRNLRSRYSNQKDFNSCICLIPSKALIPADATDFILQSALNDLWSIKPDRVQVMRTQNSQSFIYMITFISTRGKQYFILHVLGNKFVPCATPLKIYRFSKVTEEQKWISTLYQCQKK